MSRKQFDRRQPSRNIAQTILIVCEGQKTEPLYFKGIRDHRRLRTLKVKIFDAGKTDPASIINRAIEERQKIKEVGSWEPGDAAWAVLDGDEHKERDINNWRKALTIAETQKINLAITNPCFEFWYLIHFQDAYAQMTASEALKKLQKHLPNYTKVQTLYPDPLENLTKMALQRAEKITQQIDRNNLDIHSNPCCSRLPELVQMLLTLH